MYPAVFENGQWALSCILCLKYDSSPVRHLFKPHRRITFYDKAWYFTTYTIQWTDSRCTFSWPAPVAYLGGGGHAAMAPLPSEIPKNILTRYTVTNGISNLYIFPKSTLKMQKMAFQRPKFQDGIWNLYILLRIIIIIIYFFKCAFTNIFQCSWQ